MSNYGGEDISEINFSCQKIIKIKLKLYNIFKKNRIDELNDEICKLYNNDISWSDN